MLTLAEKDIQLGATAADKTTAIKMVAKLMTEAGLVTAGYVDGMLVRETQTSTYLGNGIAIPHGTTDTRDQVQTTGVKVLHFADGVAWGDGQVAHVVIGIAAKSDEHLGILRQLTRVLSDDSVAQRLKQVKSTAELMAILSGQAQAQPLLLEPATLLLDFPATDLASLQSAAAGLLRTPGAIDADAVAAVAAEPASFLGQGLWLSRVADGVSRTGVAFVRPAAAFQHQEQPVQGLLLIAACDAQHKPVLDCLINLLAKGQVNKLWPAKADEAVKLLSEEPKEGLEGVFTVINPHGLHARPSAVLVKVVKEFSSQIWVANLDGDGKAVNAKSLMKLVSLGVKKGHRLQFTAQGADAEQAIAQIGKAMADGLGEGAEA